MTATRTLLLAAGLALCCAGPAEAGAMSSPRLALAAISEPVAVVCGPFRCFQRPFWRYGAGTGFRPFAPFGARPFGRPLYSPFPLEGRRFALPRR